MNNDNIISVFHPGEKLTGKDRYKKLYHYTSFDTFLKIYYSKKLKFGAAVNMNDLMEANKWILSQKRSQLPLFFALKDTIASYKQISFTMDYDSMLKGCMSNSMWYHYGDKRNGVCIEFDFDKLKEKLPKNAKHNIVSYRYLMQNNIILPASVETINEVEAFVEQNVKKLFFTKTKEWKYENEYRIVCQNQDYLNIDKTISAVYFTQCDSEFVKATETIVNGEFDVNYINYYSEQNTITCINDITPIGNNAKRMRMKFEGINANYKNKITWMQQAEEYYDKYKFDKNKSLLMNHFVD